MTNNYQNLFCKSDMNNGILLLNITNIFTWASLLVYIIISLVTRTTIAQFSSLIWTQTISTLIIIGSRLTFKATIMASLKFLKKIYFYLSMIRSFHYRRICHCKCKYECFDLKFYDLKNCILCINLMLVHYK